MISIKKLNSSYNQVCTNIHSKKIIDALEALRGLITETQFSDYFVQIEHLESTYREMLKYTLEGIHDPEREKVYMKMQKSILELADKVQASLITRYSGWHTITLQEELRKKQKLTGKGIIESLEDLAFSTELDEILNDNKTSPSSTDIRRRDLLREIFKHLWLTDIYGEAEDSLTSALITCKDFTWYEQSLQVSAILLSALRFFDESKIHRLMDFVGLEDQQVSGRALVSLVIVLYFYDHRLYLYPGILNRLDLLNDETKMEMIFEQIIIQLARTEDTLELGKKLHEDIIPEMAKLKPDLEEKLKMEDLQDDDLEGDKNPDWESVFKDSDELYKKVDEFMKLQMEGADVYMTTFAQLKSFPFFSELTNWIVPFYEDNPDLSEIYKQESEDFNAELFISGLKKMPFLCNSDKYSFIFNVRHLPQEQKKMLSKAFEMEMESMSQMISDEELLNESFARRLVFVQYIQDLYRFFKLSPFKNEFEDVFQGKLDIYNSSFFRRTIDDPKTMRNIAEFFFENERYEEALDIFLMELREVPDDTELLQKAGFCHQQMKNFKKAIHYYTLLDVESKSGSWIVKNLGYCYRKLGEFGKALEVYEGAVKDNPDDEKITSLIGYCNLKIEKYETALKYYFKLEYLNPDNTSVIRPIAWCYFGLGQFEKSEKYFRKIMDQNPDYFDYVNFGHLKWALGQRKEAIEFYMESVKKETFDFQQLQKTLEADTDVLVKSGIAKEEIYLMIDYMKYLMS